MTALLAQFPSTFAQHYLMDEDQLLASLMPKAAMTEEQKEDARRIAGAIVHAVREAKPKLTDINQLLLTYNLNSREGIALMCVAEALLRIPDARVKNELIEDKISDRDWQKNLTSVDGAFTHFTGWALSVTGSVMQLDDPQEGWGILGGAIKRLGEPVIRAAVSQAVKIMGDQFVLGETIEAALKRSQELREKGYTHSYDMLGESARTDADAKHYYEAYAKAIRAVGAEAAGLSPDLLTRPSISIKLSALHARYEYKKMDRVMTELRGRVLELCQLARQQNVALTIDAEEADRLLPSFKLIESLLEDPALVGWGGLGLALQAYGKRALPSLEYLAGVARKNKIRIPVRLVKGAYWDSEIKIAQVDGVDGYPVFTRKVSTDVSYLACAKFMLSNPDAFYPQFATHNAYTVGCILALAKDNQDFEFQKLQGMGDALYEALRESGQMKNFRCRIYAPVGPHHDLLAYLVRRLLENGANSSFVYQISDKRVSIAELLADPVEKLAKLARKANTDIPLPHEIFAPRKNSPGILLAEPRTLKQLLEDMRAETSGLITATALIYGHQPTGNKKTITSPADRKITVGTIEEVTPDDALKALGIADQAQLAWDTLGGAARATILERIADSYIQHKEKLIALIVREGGRTIPAAIADWREAIDFLRYYADIARREFSGPQVLPGPTGERNELWLRGRGTFLCISPWNFPLAIFTGQVAAALAAGNSVLAKPANQTPIVAYEAIRMMHDAGVPKEVLHFIPGSGSALGAALLPDRRLKGVAFTGSNATAKSIATTLAQRDEIIPFIAETGGQNCMIVGSSALPEQAVMDVINSAFDSAGQRCSALRVVYVRENVSDKFIKLLQGAMAELALGDPANMATDVGPVIDDAARDALNKHITRMDQEAKLIYAVPTNETHANGTFVAPRAYEIKNISQLPGEVFGPILHVIRFSNNDDLEKICDEINSTGFGLTIGIHSRLDNMQELVRRRVRAGNYYVNRNMIGAVVGAQPFGGEGLSGTGPKAGGPHYLYRFATERTVSINTTAAGGNASLLAMVSRGE